MRDPKHPRQFTEEFRRQIVALVDSGKPRAEVMRECDLGKSTLDRWIRRVHACGSTAVLASIYFLPHGTAVGILDQIHPMRLAPNPFGTAWGSCNPGRS